MYCAASVNGTAHNDEGSENERSLTHGTVYISMSGTGELVYLVQFPATFDVVVTEYAVKRRFASKYGVLWYIY